MASTRHLGKPLTVPFQATAATSHFAGSIRAASVRTRPAAHIFVQDALPGAVYAAIGEAYAASSDAFEEQIHRGDPTVFFGSYADRLEFKVLEALGQVDPPIAEFWSALYAIFQAPEVMAAMVEVFRSGFEDRFGTTDAQTLTHLVRPSLLITKHRQNYYLGPHTDRFEKVVTCILNCAERDQLDHLGTALYEPKIPGFTCNGIVHHDPNKFNRISVLPFQPNSALIFFRDDRLFHGVERLSADDAAVSERRNVQFNLWER